MFNYANLSDVEFENLCMDVMQEMLGIPLRSYAKGKDHGIDISDESGRVIIQVKHYVNSQLSQLLRAIRREYPKVQKLAPEKYYICCSLELSRDRLDEIQKLFSGWMDSQAHIITVSIIDRFLKDPAHADILKKHYKLWLDSLNILQLISNPRKFIDCETLLSNIEAERKLFVATSAFAEAQKSLEEKKTLFIIGHPGVGMRMSRSKLTGCSTGCIPPLPPLKRQRCKRGLRSTATLPPCLRAPQALECPHAEALYHRHPWQ